MKFRITNILAAAMTLSLGLGTAALAAGGGSHHMHGTSAPMRAGVQSTKEPRTPMGSHHSNAPAGGSVSMHSHDGQASAPHGPMEMQADHFGRHPEDMETHHDKASASDSPADDRQPVDAVPPPSSEVPVMPAGHHETHGSTQEGQ